MRQAKIYVTEKVSALRTGFNLYQVRLKSGRFIMADIMNTDKLVQVVHTYQRDNYFGFFFLILSSDLNQKFLNYGSMLFGELNFTFPSSSRECGSLMVFLVPTLTYLSRMIMAQSHSMKYQLDMLKTWARSVHNHHHNRIHNVFRTQRLFWNMKLE